MGVLRKLISGAAVVALTVASATPALADRGGFGGPGGGFGGGFGGYGGYGDGGRHRDRGIDGGDVLAGLAIVGIFAAIAVAASKSSNSSRRTTSNDYPNNANQQRGSINSENAAVDACAQAAESKGGQSASVRDITAVDKNNDGWEVEGTIEQRTGWRDSTPDKHRFTCSVRYGAVDSVYIEADKVAFGY
jgi:hypothetical protein